ncbi:5-oxoprolinase [Cryptococcus neoformans Gb118]|nr:5-oxoprolinase [Cryptococcus neoformans var. grubii MW-RSA36]OXL08603.1 5-oxoprolinase [Cryptococcus neoformans var. grubii Gb118]
MSRAISKLKSQQTTRARNCFILSSANMASKWCMDTCDSCRRMQSRRCGKCCVRQRRKAMCLWRSTTWTTVHPSASKLPLTRRRARQSLTSPALVLKSGAI